MANEIQINLKLNVAKNRLVHREEPGQILVDMTGGTAAGGAQNVTTTAAAITMGSVTTAGYAYFRNTDTTNAIEIGTGTSPFVPFAKLKAGEAAVFRLGTNSPTAKAAASTVNLQYYILQD
jgi:hypothetical protein